jgi:hypothetical protein
MIYFLLVGCSEYQSCMLVSSGNQSVTLAITFPTKSCLLLLHLTTLWKAFSSYGMQAYHTTYNSVFLEDCLVKAQISKALPTTYFSYKWRLTTVLPTNRIRIVGFKVLTVVVMNVVIFSDIALHSSYVNRGSGGTYHLHLWSKNQPIMKLVCRQGYTLHFQ